MNVFDIEEAKLIKLSLFFTFLAIFILTSLLTVFAVFFDIGSLGESQKDTLLTATILQVISAILALFYSVFGLGRDKLKREAFAAYGVATCLGWAQRAESYEDLIVLLDEAKRYFEMSSLMKGDKIIEKLKEDASDANLNSDQIRSKILSIAGFLMPDLK